MQANPVDSIPIVLTYGIKCQCGKLIVISFEATYIQAVSNF
jgi:hypothetical protein